MYGSGEAGDGRVCGGLLAELGGLFLALVVALVAALGAAEALLPDEAPNHEATVVAVARLVEPRGHQHVPAHCTSPPKKDQQSTID